MEYEKLKELFSMKNLIKLDKSGRSYKFYLEQKQECKDKGIRQCSLKKFISDIVASRNYRMLMSNLKNIKKDFLYKSITHGIYHNLRASLLGFYIADKLGLDKQDVQLVLYATMYHDIGRVNDRWEPSHGRAGAEKLEQLGLPITEEELSILKAAIQGHSLEDEEFEVCIKEYGVVDEARARVIFKILKDADGLDRVRLGYPVVKLELLRNKIALSLIMAAYELESNFNGRVIAE